MSGRAAGAPFPRVVLFLRPVLRHVFLFYFSIDDFFVRSLAVLLSTTRGCRETH